MIKKSKVPSFVGNLPPKEEKRVMVATREKEVSSLYGYEGHQVHAPISFSTDKITMSNWTLPPGAWYEPAGLHPAGDEFYHILEGEAIAFNPEKGEVLQLHVGDTLLIPQGTRHQIFNFGKERVKVISNIGPKIWIEDGVGSQIPPVEKPKFFKGEWETNELQSEQHLDLIWTNLDKLGKVSNLDLIGRWPVNGEEARKAGRLIRITPEQHLNLVHGKKRHILVSLIISNNYLHAGYITIPVGGYSEMEVHKGDEVLQVTKGDLVIRTLEPEQVVDETETSHLSIEVKEGEKALIPEGVRHQYINFTNDIVKFFFTVAPEL